MYYNLEDRFQFNFPTIIRFGKGVLDEVGHHLKDQGLKTVMIVTDEALAKLTIFHQLEDVLRKANISHTVFSDIAKNPVKSNVENGTTLFRQQKCDSIIGFGGGASMDVARSIALLANHDEDLFDYEEAVGGDSLIVNEIPYFVCIPTTAGTGSEVGRSAVISCDQTHEKKIFFHPSLLAKRVFADPTLTQDLPSHLTAATGMDALSHNLEAFLAKGFHPMCDGIALEGIRLVVTSLPKAVQEPDFASRYNMLAAAMMGAVAFQKGLGVIHSCAHSLSTNFDMHHGLANAVMMPYCIEFNSDACHQKFKQIGSYLGFENFDGKRFSDFIFELCDNLNISTKLTDYNIDATAIEKLATRAYMDPCHKLNQKSVHKEDFISLFSGALE